MSDQTKPIRPLVLLGCAACLSISACSSLPKVPSPLSGIKSAVAAPFSIFRDERTPEQKRDDRIIAAYDSVTSKTDVRVLPGDRLQVSTRGRLPGSLNRLEDAFLIRAAAETINQDFDGFIIVYVDYEDSGFKFFTSPIETYPEAVEISTYEDFLVHTEEQNFFASRSARSQKRLQGIVIMVNAEDHPNGRYFGARDTYDAMIEETKFKYR